MFNMMLDIMFAVLGMSLIMSAAIILLAVLGKLLRKKTMPDKRLWCWLIVAMGLLIPYRIGVFTLPSPLHVTQVETHLHNQFDSYSQWYMTIYQGQEQMQYQHNHNTGTMMESPLIGAGITSQGEVVVVVSEDDGASGVSIVRFYEPFMLHTDFSFTQLIPWVLLPIWIMGIAAFVLFYSVRHIRFNHSIRMWHKPLYQGTAVDILEEIRNTIGIKREISLWSCAIVSTPVVMGLFRPVIVLPEYSIESNKLRLMLMHEVLHIKRGDLWARLLCLMALAVHWFNPLVYWMNRMAIEESERACDDAVIHYVGQDNRIPYSEALLFAAKQNIMYMTRRRNVTTLSYALTGEGKKLKERLMGITEYVKPQRWVLVSCTALMMVGVIAFGMVGCNTNTNIIRIEGTQTGQQNDQQTGQQAENSLIVQPQSFEGLTLNIDTSLSWMGFDEFAQKYMEANPGVSIKINIIDGFMQAYEMLPTQLMAGTAADLIDSSWVDHRNPSIQAMLADWFPVMRADPTFNENDFFMNAFEAMSIDGRLYNMPTSFMFDMIAANTTVPGVIEALGQHVTVTVADLQTIHQSIATESDFFIHDSHDAFLAVLYQLDSFIDFENRTANFNSQEFIDFITVASAITAPDAMFGGIMSSNLYSPERMAETAQRFLFQHFGPDVYQFLLPLEEELTFSGMVPLANERGELLISVFPAYALNGRAAPAVQALAWDFIRFMQNPAQHEPEPGTTWLRGGTLIPVYRPMLRHSLEHSLPSWFDWVEEDFGWRSTLTPEQSAEHIYNLLSEMAQMPLTDQVPVNMEIVWIIGGIMQQHHEGLLTSEQAAADLQNSITLALLEL